MDSLPEDEDERTRSVPPKEVGIGNGTDHYVERDKKTCFGNSFADIVAFENRISNFLGHAQVLSLSR
jgi:hypothetical protein